MAARRRRRSARRATRHRQSGGRLRSSTSHVLSNPRNSWKTARGYWKREGDRTLLHGDTERPASLTTSRPPWAPGRHCPTLGEGREGRRGRSVASTGSWGHSASARHVLDRDIVTRNFRAKITNFSVLLQKILKTRIFPPEIFGITFARVIPTNIIPKNSSLEKLSCPVLGRHGGTYTPGASLTPSGGGSATAEAAPASTPTARRNRGQLYL